jgi:hypothetical protein
MVIRKGKIKCLPPNIQIMYGSDIKTLLGANSHYKEFDVENK